MHAYVHVEMKKRPHYHALLGALAVSPFVVLMACSNPILCSPVARVMRV